MDTDELTAANVTTDISAILDDHVPPPDPHAPVFTYESVGGDGSWGHDWFVLRVSNGDAEATFRVTVEPHTARDNIWV